MAAMAVKDRPPAQLSDRELLEEVVAVLRRVRPLIEAAERLPWVRRLLGHGT
jgi:hypothetical protein